MMKLDTRILSAASLAVTIVVAGSCNDQQRAGSGGPASTPGVSAGQLDRSPSAAEPALDLGDDWQADRRGNAPSLHSADGRAPQGQPSRGGARQPSQRQSPSAQPSSGPVWSIVLNTFSGDDHEQAARNMLSHLPSVAPDVHGAYVRSTGRGSMVVYGSYASPDDPAARKDLERVQSIRNREIPVFPRAFLTRISAAAEGEESPHALLTVRQKHPNVNPLYTLQVAAWTDLDAGHLSAQEIRRNAERYARELRAQGHEAYFHHDDRGVLSIVTVGLFDRQHFDVEKGDLSPELRQLRRQFPEHLVNGEPLLELIDRHNPRRGTRPQESRLVLVPRARR